jgi:hypothetical protein
MWLLSNVVSFGQMLARLKKPVLLWYYGNLSPDDLSPADLLPADLSPADYNCRATIWRPTNCCLQQIVAVQMLPFTILNPVKTRTYYT